MLLDCAIHKKVSRDIYLHKNNSSPLLSALGLRPFKKSTFKTYLWFIVSKSISSIEEISKVDHLYEKSDWVKKNVGVYSVSDPVAHLLSEGRVIINKQKYDGITFSIGRIDIWYTL